MNQINIMLVPTAQDYLVLPAELVAHVFPYAPPLLIDGGSEYIIGGLLVQNDKIPLLDFFSHKPLAERKEEDRSNYRVILVNAVNPQGRYRQYAILAHGEPLIMNASEDDIRPLGKGSHRYISRYVTLAGHEDGKRIVLPNLMALEAELTMS